MNESALERFREEFRRWVAVHNKAHGFSTKADDLLRLLGDRLGEERLGHIGAALLNGWLETERGYFVRETHLGDNRKDQFAIIH